MKITPPFKAYDIRGIYPDEVNEELALKIAKAFVAEFSLAGKQVLVGMDARVSGPALKKKLIEGLTTMGANVVDIGMCTTDMGYFGSYHLKTDAAILVTASHNPREYNGFKIMLKNAEPVYEGGGMEELYTRVKEEDYGTSDGIVAGKVEEKNIEDAFVDFVLSFIDTDKLKDINVVVDTANGAGGPLVKKLFDKIPCTLTGLYLDPDGTFPNHGPNPLLTENRKDIIAKTKEVEANVGIALDGDCDRCFFVDNLGNFLEANFVSGIFIKNILAKDPGKPIVYDIRSSWYVPDTIETSGGEPVKTRVGHAFIKKKMRDVGAVFAAEVTGHYYFVRDDLYFDSGFVVMVQMLEYLSQHTESLYELLEDTREYFVSEEINSKVDDVDKVMAEVEADFKDKAESVDHLDGLTMEFEDWKFNLRASNTEPLLRLNVEAESQEDLQKRTEQVLKRIRKE